MAPDISAADDDLVGHQMGEKSLVLEILDTVV